MLMVLTYLILMTSWKIGRYTVTVIVSKNKFLVYQFESYTFLTTYGLNNKRKLFELCLHSFTRMPEKVSIKLFFNNVNIVYVLFIQLKTEMMLNSFKQKELSEIGEESESLSEDGFTTIELIASGADAKLEKLPDDRVLEILEPAEPPEPIEPERPTAVKPLQPVGPEKYKEPGEHGELVELVELGELGEPEEPGELSDTVTPPDNKDIFINLTKYAKGNWRKEQRKKSAGKKNTTHTNILLLAYARYYLVFMFK